MVKEETVQGMRIDTFLVKSNVLSRERLQTYRTKAEEKEIRKGLIDILNKKNRLPG